jgi:hypothetical protein
VNRINPGSNHCVQRILQWLGLPPWLTCSAAQQSGGQLGQVDLLNIYRMRTVAFHPMGNGTAEWAVRNSIKVISAIITGEVNGDPLEWDISCPKAALAINTSPTTSTSIMADDLPLVQDIDVVVCNFQEHQKRMFQAVFQATGVAQQRQKGYYDLKVKGPEISKEDFVVYEDKTNLRAGEICSLRLPYKTPLFQMARKLSNVNYEITPDGGQGPTKIVYYNQIKKVKGPGRVPGDEILEAEVPTKEAEQQPRRSGRACQRPERLGADARDPDVRWIP